jgi:ribosomal protein L7Ae-like RNA K-turn-binding protein
VKAERPVLASAVAKNLFAKAARRSVDVPADLIDRTAALLSQRCLNLIGLARRAGQVVCGFEKVRDALCNRRVGIVLAAADGAVDGRGKLKALAGELPTLALFTGAELSAALGRENAVHAALAPGRLAERLIVESARVAGLRADEGQLNDRKANDER